MTSMQNGSAVNSDNGESSLLSVTDLGVVFYTEREVVYAVDGISFDIKQGETIGLVGESGSGKSVTARSIIGLTESPGHVTDQSSIRFKGTEITSSNKDEFDNLRGDQIAMVFQDPLTALNPVYTVGNQIEEGIKLHRDLTGDAVTEEALDLLDAVGIPDPARRLKEYPHEFSGGMRQRAIIAMAIACDPDFLICDEPTTALDVTIQAQILNLLNDIQEERDLSILFITHDMGVIAQVADRVNVMYAGEIVEQGPVSEIFDEPRHPYTQGLLQSIPGRNTPGQELYTIPGEVPTPTEPATSCRFAPRCPEVFEECHKVHPKRVPTSQQVDHSAACLLYPKDQSRMEAVQTHRTEADDMVNDE